MVSVHYSHNYPYRLKTPKFYLQEKASKNIPWRLNLELRNLELRSGAASWGVGCWTSFFTSLGLIVILCKQGVRNGPWPAHPPGPCGDPVSQPV